MATEHLAQPPVLVLPHALLSKLQGKPKPAPHNQLKQTELHQFRRTAEVLKAHPWNMKRAATYLHDLCDNNEKQTWPSPPTLEWIFEGKVNNGVKLPPPPDWLNYAPLPPRTVQVTVVNPKAPAKGKAQGKAQKTKAEAKPAPKPAPKPKGKGKAKAKPEAQPANQAANPDAPRAGCSKCRWKGCSKCRG